jgi:hypothetical protein
VRVAGSGCRLKLAAPCTAKASVLAAGTSRTQNCARIEKNGIQGVQQPPLTEVLLQKFFLWGGEAKKTPSELQEQIAMALINNKLLEEADQDADPDNENDLPGFYNDPDDCKKHPEYKTNL